MMTKGTLLRLLLAAACICATEISLLRMGQVTAVEAAKAEKLDVSALPLQLGEWTGRSMKLDSKLVEKIGAISVEDRVYENNVGQSISLQLALFSATPALLPHPPDLCYRGGGWTIVSDDWKSTAAGRRYRLMRVSQNDEIVDVVYWYQMGPNSFSNRDEMRQVLQKLRWQGTAWPPFIKVLIQYPEELSGAKSSASTEELLDAIFEWNLKAQ